MAGKFAKRIFDIVGASALLLLAAPILLVAAIAIRITMGRPVLYRQARPGYKGELFVLYKLRTMSSERDANGRLLSDGKRITPLGRYLRLLSIDELPQLWNVLKGDMSLVGPRPLLARYLPRYTPEQNRRHEVKPGLTGLAQINGRNLLSWEDRFRMDVEYVRKQSFCLDLKILFLTLAAALRRGGMDPEGGENLSEFWGTEARPAGAPLSEPVEDDLHLLSPPGSSKKEEGAP